MVDWSTSFRLHQVFPILMVQMLFPNSTGPWPQLLKGREIPVTAGRYFNVCDQKLIFLLLKQNRCFGYSREPSRWDGSFEHPKHILKLMDKKITILQPKNPCLSGAMSKTHTFFAFSTIFLVAVLLVNSCSGPVCETTVTSSSLLCLPPRKRGLEATSSLPLFTGAGGFGLLRLKEFPGLLNLNPLNQEENIALFF